MTQKPKKIATGTRDINIPPRNVNFSFAVDSPILMIPFQTCIVLCGLTDSFLSCKFSQCFLNIPETSGRILIVSIACGYNTDMPFSLGAVRRSLIYHNIGVLLDVIGHLCAGSQSAYIQPA